MTCENAIGLHPPYLETVWGWFNALPGFAKKQMDGDGKALEAFAERFAEDRMVFVLDGGLLGAVVLEERSEGVFEAHLFCPRRLGTRRFAEAVNTFFRHIAGDRTIITLYFKIRRRQPRLGLAVTESGGKYTGWTIREHGEDFAIVVYDNSVAEKR